MVKIYSDRACVVHAHAKKAGSETDKEPGAPIKCYLFSKYGKESAIKKAHAMHAAIEASQAANR